MLDVFILISLYRFGAKQLLTETGKQFFPHAVTFAVALDRLQVATRERVVALEKGGAR